MENKISNVSNFNKFQQKKRKLENNDKTENFKKCKKIVSKCESFPKVCRNKSPKSIEEKELSLIYSQKGILHFMIKKFT